MVNVAKSFMSKSARDKQLKQSWDAFCDELKSAGDLIFRDNTPDNDLARAKGLRLLARNLSAVLCRLGGRRTHDGADRLSGR